MHTFDELHSSRYALLATFRRDGARVDTPIWFALDGSTLLLRTKLGPKTRRLAARPDVELTACDYRGQVRTNAATLAGYATILSGPEAEDGNALLHRRYGWQWNVVPMIKVPGVTNVHRELCVAEKLRRTRQHTVWPDSAIVRVELTHG